MDGSRQSASDMMLDDFRPLSTMGLYSTIQRWESGYYAVLDDLVLEKLAVCRCLTTPVAEYKVRLAASAGGGARAEGVCV
jgi:hypothetical protein